ncbi:MAG TPA: hypothetical protein VGB57_10710 [Allosphingosinicella sp.]|jgi:hypothetical protein
MKLLAFAAAALLALQAQPGGAQAPQAAPSEALVDRFLAVLPDREEIQTRSSDIDAGELKALIALNPGKEAKVRAILQANLACSGEAVSAGTLRMLRTVARDLGEARLKRLIAFYEGPDFAAFKALGTRMEGNPTPSAEDKAAMAKLMEAYPLQAYYEGLNRAPDIIATDEGFMSAAVKCASEQMAALEAAGLKSH